VEAVTNTVFLLFFSQLRQVLSGSPLF